MISWRFCEILEFYCHVKLQHGLTLEESLCRSKAAGFVKFLKTQLNLSRVDIFLYPNGLRYQSVINSWMSEIWHLFIKHFFLTNTEVRIVTSWPQPSCPELSLSDSIQSALRK